MNRNSIRSEEGVSLIETLVALALMGVAAWFLASMLKNGALGQKTLQAQDDSRVLTENIAQILQDPVACANTFAGSNLGNGTIYPGIAYAGANSVPSGATPFTNVLDANGNTQFTLGKTYGNRSLVLKSLYIGGSGTDAKTQIQQWTPGSGASANTGMAFVQVTWQQTGGKENQQGPQNLVRYFMVYVAHLSLGPPTDPPANPVNSIMACTAQSIGGAGNTSLWTLISSGASAGAIFNSNAGPVGIGTGSPTSTAVLDVYANARHALFVDSNSGYVGIGTASPGAFLDVNSGTQDLQLSTNGLLLQMPQVAPPSVNDQFSFGFNNSIKASMGYRSASGQTGLYFNPAGSGLGTVGEYIDSSGNVGIGTSVPSAPLTGIANSYSHFMDVIGRSSDGTGAVTFLQNDGTTEEGFVRGVASGVELGAANVPYLHLATNAGTTLGFVGIGTLSPAYNLHVVGTAGLSTGTAWTNASDIRLKDLHGEYENGLAEILQLHPVRFTYKRDNPLGLPSDHPMTGFVAQEVEKVIPEAVHENKNGFLELNVDPIHWAVVNAVKELKALIDAITLAESREVASLRAALAARDQEIQGLKRDNAEIKAYLCGKDPASVICR